MEDLVRQTRFTTFDGTLSLSTRHQRPDRLSHLESLGTDERLIPRGGGYAYSAASFGEGVLVQEMSRFNRFLAFDEKALTLRAEAGVTLLDVMQWAVARNLYFPVLPGYPLITLGGCAAADVHGKNPYRDGTFCDWLEQLTVFHPEKGYQVCSRSENPEVFALTCGGFGLTGIITDMTLRLAPLPAQALTVERTRINSLQDAADTLAASDADIAYSWHDGTPGSRFGRGILYSGHWSPGPAQQQPLKFRALDANTRGKLPLSAWNGITARAANSAMSALSGRGSTVQGVLEASFPFASNVLFHKLFGKKGFREIQFLVPDEETETCLERLAALVNDSRAPTMMLSIKRFKGAQQALSMSGSGYLVAIDCYRNGKTEHFVSELDKLVTEFNGQPNLSKDSRLPGDVAQACNPHYTRFRERLFSYDANRLMRSELSARLGLS